MTNLTDIEANIDEETINQVGLRLCSEPINAQIAPNARVFKYPNLENVYIMESDLYGNTMPKDSCFLAFNGTHGLVGKHLKVEFLTKATREDIENIVLENSDG
jgi:hypothetical protein